MSLADRLDRDPSAWQASVAGDRIVGEVLEVHDRAGKFSEFTVLVVEAELVEVNGRAAATGEWEIPAARAVLADEIRRRHVRPGDRIGVRYLGEQNTGGGQTFHAYRVVHEASAASRSAAAVMPAESRPPAQRWAEALAAMDDTKRRWVLASYAERHGDTPLDELDQDLAGRIAGRAEIVAAEHANPHDKEGHHADA